MASERVRFRHSLVVSFDSQEAKSAYKTRAEHIRSILTPAGQSTLDNAGLMSAMFDLVEHQMPAHYPGKSTDRSAASAFVPAVQSFNQNSGIYTGNTRPDDESAFLTELLEGLKTSCPYGLSANPWNLVSVVQKDHILRLKFSCHQCHVAERTWSSSRVFGAHYLLNQKMVHSVTCTGDLPVQYMKLSEFAGIGVVGHGYMKKVYYDSGYCDVVSRTAETSMDADVEEVKSLPDYAHNGEWVITDARHDSTANAYHTTVPCLSGSTKKIVAISTVSRSEHGIAQRELQCTKVVVPQAIDRGLNVAEVAHDLQHQVSRYVTSEMKLKNSFDTWHGTKNVAKNMQKITQGRVRDKGVTWFPELVDKRKSVTVHLYWAMKNCDNDEQKLRSLIESIPLHYQDNHLQCYRLSTCQYPSYTPGKNTLTDPATIQQLTKVLKDTYIYRFPESFCRCRDTYSVESFNHQLLCYVPKRIHFSTRVFCMRINLAVLDWNENVGRECTSERNVKDLRRPDRIAEHSRTPMKVLVKKIFQFVESLWAIIYVSRNMTSLEFLNEDGDDPDGLEDGLFLPCSDEVEEEDDDVNVKLLLAEIILITPYPKCVQQPPKQLIKPMALLGVCWMWVTRSFQKRWRLLNHTRGTVTVRAVVRRSVDTKTGGAL